MFFDLPYLRKPSGYGFQKTRKKLKNTEKQLIEHPFFIQTLYFFIRRTAIIPNAYPSMPKPKTHPLTTGDIRDSCRKLSLALMFEICTSITGTVTDETASRIATDVCVYPPAFKMIPSCSLC